MGYKNPTKTLAFLFLFFILPLPSTSTHIAPKPSSGARRILLGVLFGSLTGIIFSLSLLLLIRLFLLFAAREPILAGPVIFSPNIPAKSLLSSLSSPPHSSHFNITLDTSLLLSVVSIEPPQMELRRLQRELESLARAKHANVMSLRAYLREKDRIFLVYDCIESGDLEDAMKRVRNGQLVLGWEVRFRIAVGIAKGLRYLHFECSPRMLHCRLRPGNVVLDEGFEPRLAGVGLARIDAGGAEVVGSECFVAPECFQSSRYTEKNDIFSFGMILAILVTGKDPLDTFFSSDSATGGGGMARWLRHLQQAGGAREALDTKLFGDEVMEYDMLMAVRIALVCMSDLPADRPSSDELVVMLSQLHSF